MDLTPLYELRARLRAAMIAGTNLLSEDFRLKRAAEAFAPLEAASPVFAKIGQLTKALISPDQKDKEGALLDTITLVDAVLCTQGTVAVTGEMEALQGSSWGSAITNAPYSVVRKLLDALLNSGSGHYSFVVETHNEHPEIFKDYRVKSAMVQALGASYAELAEEVAKWLKQEDVSILPLLQQGFNPKGNKEMVRRVHVMQAIDAEVSNVFFVKMLPEAEKDVRLALIYALRSNPENTELLLELLGTERGNAKKTVYYALACVEDERAGKVFQELAAKKPVEAMEYLLYTKTKWASALVADTLKEILLPWVKGEVASMSQEQGTLLDAALAALPGKCGEEICEIYRMSAALEGRLKNPFEDKNTGWVGKAVEGVVAGYLYRYRSGGITFQTAIPRLLCQALIVQPDEALCTLALELYEAGAKRKDYFPAAVIAMLLTKEDCCGWLEGQREKLKGEFGDLLSKGLAGLMYSEKEKSYVFDNTKTFYNHPSGCQSMNFVQPVKQEITGCFTEILMEVVPSAVEETSRRIDNVLSRCINSLDEAYCNKLGEYFYDRACKSKESRSYLTWMRQCGWTKCEGLAVNFVKSNQGNAVYFSGLAGYVQSMPGDNAAKYAEMKKVYDLYQKGKLEIREGGWSKEQFEEFMENYKTE